ncbi:Transposase [Alloiococcus otitis]|nr:Transposase [Alloiococcus otitis]
MDGSGIPLAFNITSGNTNEQTTLKPLEKRILKDFRLSKFVVCTDAGLSSTANRKYNTLGERAFITTQSVKKTKKHLKDWLLDKSGWRLSHGKESYHLDDIDETAHFSDIFYKERWIHEDGLEQRFIVSYSPKYRQYQASVRQGQIDRALKKFRSLPGSTKKERMMLIASSNQLMSLKMVKLPNKLNIRLIKIGSKKKPSMMAFTLSAPTSLTLSKISFPLIKSDGKSKLLSD